MKTNRKKFQFMNLGKDSRLPGKGITKSNVIRSLDNCLTFKDHIDTLCRNASYKLHALRRTRKYLTPDKAKVLYNTFINS